MPGPGPEPMVQVIWYDDADPTIAPGMDAPTYQLLVRTDTTPSQLYWKSGGALTAWTQIGGGGGAGGVIVEDEGVSLGSFTTLNFAGAGVTATDAGGGVATITIPGGITGIVVKDEGVSKGTFQALNFIGAGVTAADAGSGVASVTIPGASVALGLQAFRYTCTGAEGADFFVPLPVARANDSYRVQATAAGMTLLLGFDCPDLVAADRTTTQFRVRTTASVTAADQIDFLVTDVV